ncbi:MAG: hypothetical protein IPP81_15210 [Chitinophagaceae bacterium]|nr:hypothetical protein [Chitinophagaceae bacterium]
MKTIFTLLFSMAMFSTTFAQYGQNGQRDRGKDNDVYASNDNRGYDRHDKNYGGYVFTPRERDMQITQINREYDYKMQSVKNKPYMGWFQKKRLINNLEAQRDEEIAQVIRKFRSPKNMFGDFRGKDRKKW